jgi:hypothetical protein
VRFIFLALALLLFFAWIGAFVMFHVTAALIHLLLVFAVIFLIIHLVSGSKSS